MGYITVKEAAAKWGVTPRHVQVLCSEKKIKGAVRFGRSWMIPERAVLPGSANKEDPRVPMPRKSPFLDMTDLYSVSGEADELAEMLVNNPEAYLLFKAEIAYRRGDIDEVYDHARYFLSLHSGFYAVLGGGMLLALCAIWRGDVHLWSEAKRHICEAPSTTAEEREIISLTLAIIDSSIYDNNDFPEWFTSGNFEALPADAHPAAKVFYIKYLYMAAFALASNQTQLDGMEGLALMRMLPNTIEPLITQAVVDRTVIPEIFLRMSCAVAYHNSGLDAKAEHHIDKALSLALSDKLYGILVEYIRHFDGLLEEKIAAIDPTAAEIVAALYARYSVGWSRLSGSVRNRYIAHNLTPREREVAKLTAFGFTAKEIGAMTHRSESTIKQTIIRVIQKTGIGGKDEISSIL